MKPMFRERLEKIIRGWPSGDDVVDNGGADQILNLVKSCVPPMMFNDDGTPRAVDEVVKVWNECRQFMLTNLGEDT